ncbi:spore germination protein KB [Bacillus pakistanensis]|uniref:Spore germination protein KB n=1 Tax=Rossellomorea pakistanensis TaxID=992288 RepID=A0ABS2NCR5_9BACI|nr:endospore germination permease [Bacillus pakistanensis]MBM7585636.1 spore germination protein KB [Bacillus pakistanensis]
MVDNTKISPNQFTVLFTLFVIGDTILFIPANVTVLAKQDAWISALLASVLGVLLVSLYSLLGNQFPSKNIIQIGEKVLGPWVGKMIGLLFISFFFIDAGVILWQLGDFMKTQIMPETPIQAILILFLSIIIMGTRLGIEVMARAAEIFLPWVLILFVVLIISISPEIKFENIQPVLEDGIKPLFGGTIPIMGYYLESVILLMFFPYINQKSQATKAYISGMLIGSICLSIIIFLSITVLGADLTNRNMYPSYAIAKKINIGNFFQRIEALLAFIWYITLFFKLLICFYATILGLAQILKINNQKIVTLPMGIILVNLSLIIVPNSPYFIKFVLSSWWAFTLSFGLFLPLFILVISQLQKKNT